MESTAHHEGEPGSMPLAGDGIIEQVRDHAMFLVDPGGRITSWNQGVQTIFGCGRDEWIGLPVRELFTPEDVAAGVPEQEMRRALETGRADDDRWMLRRSGKRFFATGTLTRITDHSGQPVGFLKVVQDGTEPLRALDERDRLLASERAARAEAERQAAALTAAIEAIPDGVYIGDANGIIRCNRPALEMLGASSPDELRARADELARAFRMRHGRDGPEVKPEELPYTRALQGQTAVLDTWATKKSTGEDVFIRGTAAPIVVDGKIVGVVAVNSDLTDRLQLEEKQHQLSYVETELRERDEQLRAVFAGVRDYAIFTVDVDGRISSWHEGAAIMKRYTAQEAIGMPFANLFTEENRACGQPEREMEIAARTGEYKGEGKRVRGDGEIFDAAVVLTALRGPRGELLGYLKLTQDITDRRRQEREREELLKNAEAARAEAERTSQAMGEFLATISHELRTPLSAILGWAHMLERGTPDPGSLKQALAAITRNARIQVQLIEDLLDLNRIESGQLRLHVQPVEPAGVLAKAIDAVLPAATAKNIDIRTVLDPRAGIVSADPERLQQIVWNLLTNAVKFTPAGGKVTVALTALPGQVEISVADSGQGISAAFLARMFDRFQQQDASTTRRHGGLGIGLSIARQLAQLHGGSIRAESPGVGKGATFRVTLPVLASTTADAGDFASGPGAPQEPGPDRAPLSRVTVLLVEDEADVREVAAYALQSAGARVLSAASATEGFELFRAHRPDAILCDIGMPEHDGYDFMRWVRRLRAEEGGRTPAAALTAFARPEDRRRALAVGFQTHLVKPVEPGELVDAVAGLATNAR
ncbi:MAG TPA: PAS domain S-box protein [Caldimonas sp.]|nr:PAS domain S-box protein [Caldimonas sp.]HEX2542455.1 PAS domain S-box protein [Caldimonas sp.]